MSRRLLGIGLAMAMLAACGGDDSGDDDDTPDAAPTYDTAPTIDATGCVDDDEDGYGAGCVLGDDCDDTDPLVNPAGTEDCDGVDNDCNDLIDDDLLSPDCTLQAGVCAGALESCGAVAGWLECGSVEYGADYEEVEGSCDGLDNDCDGATDEDLVAPACALQDGVCAGSTQTCGGAGGWLACIAEDYGFGYEATETLCDGLDNDCDGATDEDLAAQPCALQAGVCAGAVATCGGSGGWLSCGAAEYGATWQADETTCDGLDNDCDLTVDEGCPCTVGATQPCGTDVGPCTTGTQTCTAAGWGDCEGDIPPGVETCDGTDEDCTGVADDNLTAPPCDNVTGACAGSVKVCGGAGGWIACAGAASYGSDWEEIETLCDGVDNDCDAATDEMAPPLCEEQDGVCAGSTKICGGAAGWQACSAANYGASYVATEDGGADENVCDALDNDCDLQIDEECIGVPVLGNGLLPSIYDQYIAFLRNDGTDLEVHVADLRTGAILQLTSNTVDEVDVDVYGPVVVYQRGTGSAARVLAYDLATGTETALSATTAYRPRVSSSIVVWEDWRSGTSADVYAYVLPSGPEFPIAVTAADEMAPHIRGGNIVYTSDATGVALVHVYTISSTPTDVAQNPAATYNQSGPLADWGAVSWTDGRNAAAPWDHTVNWDVRAAMFTGLATEAICTSATGAQFLSDASGYWVAWSDFRNGNWDVGLGFPFATTPYETLLTSGTAQQANPALHGNIIVWEDGRLGTTDLFGAAYAGWAPEAGDFVVNEFLANPGTVDANGDGAVSISNDEFVELVNVTGLALDLTGCTLRDAATGTPFRHAFPAGTTVPGGGALVVFGGGTPTGAFGGVQVHTASTGALGLNNSGGDTITLTCPVSTGGTVDVTSVSYSTSTAGVSSVCDPEYACTSRINHPGTPFSPGTAVDGYGF